MNIETANRLLQYRKKLGLSQEELAEKIGVSRQAVSKWERAEASPDTDNLILLSRLYGVSLDEMLKGEIPDNDEDETESEKGAEEDEGGRKEPDEDISYKKADYVSFKDGVHVNSKHGDHVHINFKEGVNVDGKNGDSVHVGWDGIHVEENGKNRVYTDENGQVMIDEELMNAHRTNIRALEIWNKFPFVIVAVIIFLIWGFSGLCFGWTLSWLVLLTIPLYYTLGDAIFKRNPNHFAYPVLTVMCYIVFGYYHICGGWEVGWVVFLTIPIYYCICAFKRH